MYCWTGSTIYIAGTGFGPDGLNVTIITATGTRYNCSTIRFGSDQSVWCTLPDMAESHLNQTLAVQVGCNGVISNTVQDALSSWGQLIVRSVSGCANTTGNVSRSNHKLPTLAYSYSSTTESLTEHPPS